MGRPLNIETGVNRFESERERREKLENLLSMFAQEINAEASKHGVRNLLDPEGRIKVENYSRTAGGIFPPEKIKEDQGKLRETKILQSRANLPAVQEHYKTNFGITSIDGIIKKREELKKQKTGQEAEMALTILLQKILGKNFWVVRSSEYDDNLFGIDTIVINKETGEAVCGLDDTTVDENVASDPNSTDKLNSKKDQVIRYIRKGRGGYAEYGLKVNRGQLQRARMTNLPVFFFGINTKELRELTDSIKPNSHEVSQKERDTFGLMVASLKEQLEEYTQITTHQVLKDKYNNFGKMLSNFEKIALEN